MSSQLSIQTWLARFLSTEGSFPLPIGGQFEPGRVHGYYIDMRVKAPKPSWPTGWPGEPGLHSYDAFAQMALGCYERYIAGEGEPWLRMARAVGDLLIEHQQVGGPRDGGLVHHYLLGHTFPIRPPSLSAMAQGQAASLLVRLHLETGEERFADAARRALRPFAIPTSRGGVQARLDGRPFPEEYPTHPSSYVLNGAIFAMWGQLDVGLGLGDEDARGDFEESVITLARNVHRWDSGSWSLYDLFPHPLPNVASPAYHALHTNQLKAMQLIEPRPELAATINAFERYAASRAARTRAFALKLVFRAAVPRSPRLARVWPGWVRRQAQSA